MASSDLTSVTEPNPGGGSPVWQYAYSGNYLSSVGFNVFLFDTKRPPACPVEFHVGR